MELPPRGQDKLLILTAALITKRHKVRGLKHNYPAAVSFPSATIMAGTCDGRTVTELMGYGTKPVTVHQPIA